MKSHRSLIRTLVVLLGLAAPLYAVDTASAGPLLSGYGGPGQGNQAILGSTLLGGGSSGGGGGTTGGGGSGGGAASPTASGSSTAGSNTGTGSASRTSRHAHHSANGSSHAVRKLTSPAPAGPTQLAPAAAKTKEGSQPLGLSGRDLLYVLLALALLAATAVLTLRLARPAPATGSTKGIRSRTRVPE